MKMPLFLNSVLILGGGKRRSKIFNIVSVRCKVRNVAWNYEYHLTIHNALKGSASSFNMAFVDVFLYFFYNFQYALLHFQFFYQGMEKERCLTSRVIPPICTVYLQVK